MKVRIKGGNEIWIQQQGAKERLLLGAGAHEGFSELELSPDQEWLTVLVTYPYDGVGTRVEQYHALVNLLTGERTDKYGLQEKFRLKERVTYFLGWVEKKPSTLRVLLADDSEAEVELPSSR